MPITPAARASIGEGVAQEDGVVAVGTCRQKRDRCLDELFQAFDVFDGLGGKVGEAAGAARALLPAVELLVDRQRAGLRPNASDEIVQGPLLMSAEISLAHSPKRSAFMGARVTSQVVV
jgi:hypothetical protein